MDDLGRVEVQCFHCKKWFRSPIPMTDTQMQGCADFAPSYTICVHCHKAVHCSAANLRTRQLDERSGHSRKS